MLMRVGVGYQPEDRQLFDGLAVDKNLCAPIWTTGSADVDEDEVVADIYDLFPGLATRRDAEVLNLSGGQGKMAAVGRALAFDLDIIILSEPLEGLTTVVVEELKERIQSIKERGISVLVGESNATHLREFADRMYVIDRGEIMAEGPPETLLERERIRNLMQGSGTA
jgi:branched-chain amino acid transport system ATP-binding protein